MGNRLVKGSKNFGVPRDYEAERAAREHYENRAKTRPKQKYNPATKTWSHEYQTAVPKLQIGETGNYEIQTAHREDRRHRGCS